MFDNENPTRKSPATCTVEDTKAEHQVCLETLFDNILRFNAFQWNGISFPTRLGWGNPSLWTLIARSCTCLVDSIPNVRNPKDRCAWRKVAIDWIGVMCWCWCWMMLTGCVVSSCCSSCHFFFLLLVLASHDLQPCSCAGNTRDKILTRYLSLQ